MTEVSIYSFEIMKIIEFPYFVYIQCYQYLLVRIKMRANGRGSSKWITPDPPVIDQSSSTWGERAGVVAGLKLTRNVEALLMKISHNRQYQGSVWLINDKTNLLSELMIVSSVLVVSSYTLKTSA